ncbi:rhodanese-like domain-containing protein [Arenibacter sp. BSSL-BM3]|uniref:Rhodanese-like domain-containing protein n=1 Tax=Arenibacter arenosicollis TaxID=2762274 RepID=A0ABR7QKF6_9FLAO|nr:rhodanese-like domain-containing protein [Arenibacter arenosicollis]MBC8767634.1 rhodanese-like domain-containing protein [Arenibacter arenosicollis]
MRAIFLFLVVIVLQTGCSQENVSKMPITEFNQELLDNAILVDVRTPEEFGEGHLENAKNINWYDQNFAENFSTVDKDKTIYVYCKMGGRSAKAQEKLKSLGFNHVVNLEGGYDAVKNKK